VRPVERILAPVEEPANGNRGATPVEGLAGFNLTDLGNSERFVADHGDDVLYCYAWSKWLVWTGARWERDDGGKVHRLAKATVRNIYREAAAAEDEKERKALAAHAKSSEAEARIRAMLELAKSDVPVFSEQLDARPWYLSVQNGTIDLRTGDLRPHRREDLITKLAPVKYRQDAEAPRFLRYLDEVFAGDEQLIAFVQRFAGYSLAGSTEERVFAILHGTGKNGKTTLVELLRDVLGDYAANTSAETILSRRNEGINNDVAALKGARFVSAAEVEQDRRLAESKVKNLTGTDTVTARFLYSEPFEFRPEFKLWLSTNNKPVIRGTDDAIWDRIRLIPFEQRFAGDRCDPKLPGKLREELPGVLAWMVRGCLEWQREGLGDPEKVRAATEGYRAEQDALAAFIEERCVVGPEAWVKFSDLYAAYQEWCEEAGEKAETKRRLGSRLKDRGFEPGRGTGNAPIRRGLGLLDDPHPDPEGGSRVTSSGESYSRVTGDNPDKYAESSESSYPSYSGIQEPPLKNARDGSLQKQGNLGNSGNSEALEEQRRLSAEEAERVKRLIAQGMNPELARGEVLKKRDRGGGAA
jgi:putative DNA primase/helicase